MNSVTNRYVVLFETTEIPICNNRSYDHPRKGKARFCTLGIFHIQYIIYIIFKFFWIILTRYRLRLVWSVSYSLSNHNQQSKDIATIENISFLVKGFAPGPPCQLLFLLLLFLDSNRKHVKSNIVIKAISPNATVVTEAASIKGIMVTPSTKSSLFPSGLLAAVSPEKKKAVFSKAEAGKRNTLKVYVPSWIVIGGRLLVVLRETVKIACVCGWCNLQNKEEKVPHLGMQRGAIWMWWLTPVWSPALIVLVLKIARAHGNFLISWVAYLTWFASLFYSLKIFSIPLYCLLSCMW